MGATLLAAAGGHSAFGPRYGGEARVAVSALPATFAPDAPRGAAGRLVGRLVHERLVEWAGGAATPSLAAGLDEGASGREWTIRLRAGAVFHDGAPVTPADVSRSLRRFLRSPSPAAARLADLLEGGSAYRAAETDALAGLADEGEAVVLRLRTASRAALAALAAPEAAITGARGAGAGPFVPTTPAPIHGRARFVAFSRHVRGRPFLDAVAVDAAPSSPAALSPSTGGGPLAAALLLVLDGRAQPVARVEDRRRVAAAVDGAELVRLFLPGGARSSLLPPALFPAPAAEPRPAARAAHGSLALAVGTDVPPAVSQRVVAVLTAAGLGVTVTPHAPDHVWSAPAEARLALFTPSVPDPLLALDELAALAPGADTAAARSLRDRAAVELDRERRAALLARAEAALRDTAVLVPLAAAPLGFRGMPGMHGAVIDAGGRILLEDAWLEP